LHTLYVELIDGSSGVPKTGRRSTLHMWMLGMVEATTLFMVALFTVRPSSIYIWTGWSKTHG